MRDETQKSQGNTMVSNKIKVRISAQLLLICLFACVLLCAGCEITSSKEEKRDYIIAVDNTSKQKIDSIVVIKKVITNQGKTDTYNTVFPASAITTTDYGTGYTHEVTIPLDEEESSQVIIEYTLYSFGVPFLTKERIFGLDESQQKQPSASERLLVTAMAEYQARVGLSDTLNSVVLEEVFAKYMALPENTNPEIFYAAFTQTENANVQSFTATLTLQMGDDKVAAMIAAVATTSPVASSNSGVSSSSAVVVSSSSVVLDSGLSSADPITPSSADPVTPSSSGPVLLSSSVNVAAITIICSVSGVVSPCGSDGINNEPGSITSNISGVMNIGDSANLTAIPNAGYLFNEWVDASTEASSVVIAPFGAGNIGAAVTLLKMAGTVRADFTKENYGILIDTIVGGTISLGGAPYVTAENASLTYLVPAVIIATPDAGYAFSHWQPTGIGVTVANVALASTTISASSVGTLKAVFVPEAYLITLNTTEDFGTISIDGAELINTYSYVFGTSIDVESTPDFGYSFNGWDVNKVTLTDNTVAATQITDVHASGGTIRALYSARTFAISTYVTGGTGSFQFSGNYTTGATESLSIVPDFGYTFVKWIPTNATLASTLTESTSITAITSETVSIIAELTPKVITITTETSGAGTIDFDGSFISGITEEISAQPGFSSNFVRWETENVTLDDTTSDVTSITAVDSASSWVIRAVFLETDSGTVTDKRDNQVYNWKKFGTQVWMQENLNYDEGISSKCPGSMTNCGIYGRLYQWNVAMDDTLHEGTDVCPVGWHLPGTTQWSVLRDYVDLNNGSEGIGKSLKSTVGWNGTNAGLDQFGFGLMPGGATSPNGSNSMGFYGFYWTSTLLGDMPHHLFFVYTGDDISDKYNWVQASFMSIRCIQDGSP